MKPYKTSSTESGAAPMRLPRESQKSEVYRSIDCQDPTMGAIQGCNSAALRFKMEITNVTALSGFRDNDETVAFGRTQRPWISSNLENAGSFSIAQCNNAIVRQRSVTLSVYGARTSFRLSLPTS